MPTISTTRTTPSHLPSYIVYNSAALVEYFQSLDNARMWWYNILGDNEGSISHILQIYPITPGHVLINSNLVALKRENNDPILTVKRTEWITFIDYFGLSIEFDLSRVVKTDVYIFHIGYIPSPSYVKLHIARHNMEKYFNL